MKHQKTDTTPQPARQVCHTVREAVILQLMTEERGIYAARISRRMKDRGFKESGRTIYRVVEQMLADGWLKELGRYSPAAERENFTICHSLAITRLGRTVLQNTRKVISP